MKMVKSYILPASIILIIYLVHLFIMNTLVNDSNPICRITGLLLMSFFFFYKRIYFYSKRIINKILGNKQKTMKNPFKIFWKKSMKNESNVGIKLMAKLNIAIDDLLLDKNNLKEKYRERIIKNSLYAKTEINETIQDINEYYKMVRSIGHYGSLYPNRLFVPFPIIKDFCRNNNCICIPIHHLAEQIPKSTLKLAERFRPLSYHIIYSDSPYNLHELYESPNREKITYTILQSFIPDGKSTLKQMGIFAIVRFRTIESVATCSTTIFTDEGILLLPLPDGLITLSWW